MNNYIMLDPLMQLLKISQEKITGIYNQVGSCSDIGILHVFNKQ